MGDEGKIKVGPISTGHIVRMGASQQFYGARDVADELGDDLEKLKRQVDDLHATAASNKQLGLIVDRLDDIGQTIDSASRTSERLRAEVVLPEAEEMAVRLVPSNSLDRLEEYRSDENKAYLFVGIFLGAVLGILSNWVTAQDFEITRVSGAFMVLFVVLAAIAGAWALQCAHRSRRVRSSLLGPSARRKREVGEESGQVKVGRPPNVEPDAQEDG